MGGHTHSRDVDDRRRTGELDKSTKTNTFKSQPSLGQLVDGQVVVIKGSGKILWRDGNDLWELTGTKVS
ncbi:MAG: hypothetical protein ACW99G_01705 [Candidatus Thorarchaeota archaeon]|jgi:hypothetical protein